MIDRRMVGPVEEFHDHDCGTAQRSEGCQALFLVGLLIAITESRQRAGGGIPARLSVGSRGSLLKPAAAPSWTPYVARKSMRLRAHMRPFHGFVSRRRPW